MVAGLGVIRKNVPAAADETTSVLVVSVIERRSAVAIGLMLMFRVADVGLVTVTELTAMPLPLNHAVVTPSTKCEDCALTTTLRLSRPCCPLCGVTEVRTAGPAMVKLVVKRS